MREAAYFHQHNGLFSCQLCPNLCVISEGRKGRCLSRGVENGRMEACSYAVVVASNLDPVEKKPLYHLCPGHMIYSVGSFGCNLHCRFCQNADISQNIQPGAKVSPEQLVRQALSLKGNIGVAFTYNEPGIWYEYICDCAPLLRQAGLITVMVTNGYLCPEPWQDLCQIVDAMNIDIKSFSSEFYRKICGGQLETVKNNIHAAVEAGVHVELTHLVVTGLNDNEDEFAAMVTWIAGLGREIPLHISRYFPRFHETAPATDPRTIEKFVRIAREHLQFVYPGNLDANQDTRCPECHELWVRRTHYQTQIVWAEPTCKCGKKLTLQQPGQFRTEPRSDND